MWGTQSHQPSSQRVEAMVRSGAKKLSCWNPAVPLQNKGLLGLLAASISQEVGSRSLTRGSQDVRNRYSLLSASSVLAEIKKKEVTFFRTMGTSESNRPAGGVYPVIPVLGGWGSHWEEEKQTLHREALPHKTTHQQMNRPTKLKIKTQLSYDHDPVNTGVTGEGDTSIYNSHAHYPFYGTLIADISPQSPNIFLRLLRLHTHTEGTDFLGS